MASSHSYNHKLLLTYDGSAFFGWQKTKEGPSIQETVEEAAEIILREPISLTGASRTDRGVHAVGQVVAFQSHNPITSYATFQKGLNALLPLTIRVLKAEKAALDFHPTLEALTKEYRYYICQKGLPHHLLYSWHYPYALDLDKMKEAAAYFLGEHDFAAFTNVKKNERYDNTVRRLDQFDIIEGERLEMRLVGNHFLYKMVRNLVGTVVYVGRGKIALEELPLILHQKERRLAGITAPASGLWLHHIHYRDYVTEKRPLLVS